MSLDNVVWDPTLVQKYNNFGPRYTSYPTVLAFSEAYSEQDFCSAATHSDSRSLSLYVHLPFCHQLCYFCACNKVITRHSHKADTYLLALEKEIRHRAPLFSAHRITQLHWGGGTPTFLTPKQMSHLLKLLRTHFQFSNTLESSIEIDPRNITLETLEHLHAEGFNRISIGIQDLNKEVQRVINREQDEPFIAALLARARALGFCSINLDLIYGLPKQNCQSFAETVRRIIELAPNRLSLFNYAHLPHHFPGQNKITSSDLPSATEKLAILQQSITLLTTAEYRFIGMDHFALPNDELALAQQHGQLHRNFQGYTTQRGCDLLGLGVSAISLIGNSYAQNQKVLSTYYAAIEQDGHAVWRGLMMTPDDSLRHSVIQSLMCHFKLDYVMIEQQYDINFLNYFAEDVALLTPLADDGLVIIGQHDLQVTSQGRLLIRNICLCFDRYSRQQAKQQQFSRLI